MHPQLVDERVLESWICWAWRSSSRRRRSSRSFSSRSSTSRDDSARTRSAGAAATPPAWPVLEALVLPVAVLPPPALRLSPRGCSILASSRAASDMGSACCGPYFFSSSASSMSIHARFSLSSSSRGSTLSPWTRTGDRLACPPPSADLSSSPRGRLTASWAFTSPLGSTRLAGLAGNPAGDPVRRLVAVGGALLQSRLCSARRGCRCLGVKGVAGVDAALTAHFAATTAATAAAPARLGSAFSCASIAPTLGPRIAAVASPAIDPHRLRP